MRFSNIPRWSQTDFSFRQTGPLSVPGLILTCLVCRLADTKNGGAALSVSAAKTFFIAKPVSKKPDFEPSAGEAARPAGFG